MLNELHELDSERGCAFLPGNPPVPPEAVRVLPFGSRGHLHAADHGAAAHADAVTAELDVTFDYVSGCQRSHGSRVAAPVVQPFS
jgi:hypothetical protein